MFIRSYINIDFFYAVQIQISLELHKKLLTLMQVAVSSSCIFRFLDFVYVNNL